VSSATAAEPPLISVVLPFKDAELTLEESLVSILAQTFRRFELIAINDHSSDCSVACLRRQLDPRVKLMTNPGTGIVAALNHGIAMAKTLWIARMDADDIMHPSRLQLQWDYLQQHPHLVLLGTGARLFPEELVTYGYREYMRWQNSCNSEQQIADEIYLESPFAHPTVIFNKAVVARAGGYRQGPFPEDYELWLRLHQGGHAMAKLPHVLLHWRESQQRTSRVDPRCSRQAFDQIRAEYLAQEPRLCQQKHNFVIWGAGRRTRQRCAHLLERGFKPRAWVDIDEKKVGNQLAGVPVVAAEWLEALSPKPLVLIYVANHGARERCALALESWGYQRGLDYLPVG